MSGVLVVGHATLGCVAVSYADPPGGGGGTGNPTEQVVSPYRSGISISFPGMTYGLQYLVENMCHDIKNEPRHVIYAVPGCVIDFNHNAANILGWRQGSSYPAFPAGAGPVIVGAAPGTGVIRVRPDMELGVTRTWGYPGTLHFDAWSGAQALTSILYPGTAVAMIGSTGSNGVTPTSTTCINGTFYQYGNLDSFGDEWHTLDVADDDSALAAPYNVNTAIFHDSIQGDSKRFVIVTKASTGPGTPCLSFFANDAAAEFYTTPGKVYWVGKIHAQTTYAAGNVTLEVNALGGFACKFSLVVEGNSRVWQDYSVPINLSGLSANTRYELAYRIGASGTIKTRIIHYAPTRPSAGETHPAPILWADTSDLNASIARMLDTGSSPPNRTYIHAAYLQMTVPGNSQVHQRVAPYLTPLGDGHRTRNQSTSLAAISAVPLLAEGAATYPTLATFLHDSLLDHTFVLEPIGAELLWENGTPTEEILNFGYYSCQPMRGIRFGYSVAVALGLLTPIEDYRIRDTMARFCHTSLLLYGGNTLDGTNFIDVDGMNRGMWDTAWLAVAETIAVTMPSYDTPYYGTSGAPNGSMPAAHTFAPFAGVAHTWHAFAVGKTITLSGGLNPNKRSGFYGLIKDNGLVVDPFWFDRPSYLDAMIGTLWECHMALLSVSAALPHWTRACILASSGSLDAPNYPLEGDCTQVRTFESNHLFPTVKAAVLPVADWPYLQYYGELVVCSEDS